MPSKARTLVKGSALRMFEFFATALVTLAMTPFVIHSLGDVIYGLWVFVGSFLGYYGLMDFGLISAVKRYITRAVGTKDYLEVNKVVTTVFVIFSIIGCVALFVSFGITIVIPLLIKNISDV